MNFSVTGLAFHGDDSVQPDDLLLIELQLRGHIDPLGPPLVSFESLHWMKVNGMLTTPIALRFSSRICLTQPIVHCRI